MLADRPASRQRALLALLTALGLLWVGLTYQAEPASYSTPPVSSKPGQYQVSSVQDGDTLTVVSGQQLEVVRLIGIDTPEINHPRKPQQCFSSQASQRTKQLAEGQFVRLQADRLSSNRDKYNRLLRYAYLPDGRSLNQILIEEGFAFAYLLFPFERSQLYADLEAAAAAASRGLWAACRVDSSQAAKQTAPL